MRCKARKFDIAIAFITQDILSNHQAICISYHKMIFASLLGQHREGGSILLESIVSTLEIKGDSPIPALGSYGVAV